MTSNKVLPGEQPNEMNNNACDHSPCQPQVVTLPPPDGGPGTKATRKARNRRGRSDAIEHKLYCFPDCKRGRAQSESMVQCHACQTWAHYECIDEGEDDIVGIWTCNACRKMPTMVMELIGMVAKLQESESEMRDTNAQLVGMLSDQQSELHHLREDFNERLPVDTANTHAETTIESPPKPTTLLVVNSLLRNVQHPVANDGSDVSVQSKSGATLADLTDMLEKHTDVANVIIVGGTREVHNETTTLDEINDGFSRMIDTAKTATNTVYVCSVLPTSANKNDERRERANEMIRATCEVKNAKFINNDLNFTYLATRRRSSKTAYTSRRMDSINYCRTFHYLNGNSLQLQDRGKTDRPIVKGRRRKERRATLAVTGRTLTGLLQARHVGQRAATTLQNRHGTPLASAENAARRTTSRRSADTTLP